MEKVRILFKKHVPRFVAEDLDEYGPFEPGDIAEIPRETAYIIINRGYGVPEANEEV